MVIESDLDEFGSSIIANNNYKITINRIEKNLVINFVKTYFFKTLYVQLLLAFQ